MAFLRQVRFLFHEYTVVDLLLVKHGRMTCQCAFPFVQQDENLLFLLTWMPESGWPWFAIELFVRRVDFATARSMKRSFFLSSQERTDD